VSLDFFKSISDSTNLHKDSIASTLDQFILPSDKTLVARTIEKIRKLNDQKYLKESAKKLKSFSNIEIFSVSDLISKPSLERSIVPSMKMISRGKTMINLKVEELKNSRYGKNRNLVRSRGSEHKALSEI
jgi:hypothetical protein